MGKVERITMFKIAKEEDRERVLEQYKVLKRTAVKVRSVRATKSHGWKLFYSILHPPEAKQDDDGFSYLMSINRGHPVEALGLGTGADDDLVL